mgnify:CR=1 FL=1
MSTQPDLSDIEIIAFDADDTLWHTENLFRDVQDELSNILEHYASHDDVQAHFHDMEMRNIKIFGYGVKGFTLSMVETAIEISNQKISAKDIHKIVMLGKALLESPLELFEGVHEVLSKLSQRYRLFLITKGDVLDQRNKIVKSGLEPLFEQTIVVQEKDPATYKALFDEHKLQADCLVMVGNSLRSDVLPVLELGGVGIHIAYHTTAHFELVEDVPDHPKFLQTKALADLIGVFG